MHNNVKFVLRDEDIQVNIIQSWYSDLSWGWAFVPFCMSWGWRSPKKLPPLRIISGTALITQLPEQTSLNP